MKDNDSLINDKSYEKLLHNKEYYQQVFKKTEKVISVVFYILNNITVEKKSETHTSNIASKAHFAHENALRSLEAKPATAKEVLEQFAQSLIGLESTLRIARVADVIPADIYQVLNSEVAVVLSNISGYISSENTLSDVFTTLDTGAQSARSAVRKPSSRAASLPTSVGMSTPVGQQKTAAPSDRRTRIQTILEAKGEATIKDISEIVSDVSEKTIQRELNAMIEDNVVVREGERRWSKYKLA